MVISMIVSSVTKNPKALLSLARTAVQVTILSLWLMDIVDESLLLLSVVVLVSLFLGPVFCGWLCPIGFLQDITGWIGARLHKLLRLSLPDLPAWTRIIRYFVLGFTLLFIVWRVTRGEGEGAGEAIIMKAALVGIAAFSLLWPRFFCRRICPVGALLGLMNLIKLFPIRRDENRCPGCGRCDFSCPMGVCLSDKPNNRNTVCISCYRCLVNCPVEGTLSLKKAQGV